MTSGRPRRLLTLAAVAAALLATALVGAGADPDAETRATLDALDA